MEKCWLAGARVYWHVVVSWRGRNQCKTEPWRMTDGVYEYVRDMSQTIKLALRGIEHLEIAAASMAEGCRGKMVMVG